MRYINVWYCDGSLRDISVLGVTLSHWQQLVDWLRTNPYPIEFYLDGERAPLPVDVSEIFERRNEIGALLAIDVEGVFLNCHFFRHKEIEFDIDPREVDSEQKESGIIDFMRALGRLLNKEVILTPENWRETALLTYLLEQDEIVHNPVWLEPTEAIELSREEMLKVMAGVYGMDENDEAAVIDKILEAANKPAYDED